MKGQNSKTKWLHLRLSEDEYKKIHHQFAQTTSRKLSDYARKILLGKPLVSTYRNQSLDDFMAEVIRLRKELNGVGNNFNQVVKKLHTLNHTTDVQQWIVTCEREKTKILSSVESIEKVISKMADK